MTPRISLHSHRPDMGPPAKICQRKNAGVPCDRPVKWQIGFTIHPPKRYGRHPVPGDISLYVRDVCGSALKVEDVVGDDLWRRILQSFRAAGLIDPDRGLTELRLLPVLDL